jgi:ketosteroid isomerase-like protein
MLTQAQAERLAADWVRAFNRHDLEAILAHYADDAELTSPFVVQLLNDPHGTLKGKAQLRAYFSLALSLFPDLTFTVLRVFPGVSSLVVYYRGVDDVLAAEVMLLNPQGQVSRGYCHYYAGE